MATPDVVQDQLAAASSLGCLAAFLIGGAIALPLLVRYHRVPARDAPPWMLLVGSLVLGGAGSVVLPHVAYERRLYVDAAGARFTSLTLFGERSDQAIRADEARRVVLRRWTGTGHKNVPIRGTSLIVESERTQRNAAIEVGTTSEEQARDLAKRLGVPFVVEGTTP